MTLTFTLKWDHFKEDFKKPDHKTVTDGQVHLMNHNAHKVVLINKMMNA